MYAMSPIYFSFYREKFYKTERFQNVLGTVVLLTVVGFLALFNIKRALYVILIIPCNS